eukprot:11218412-Alexandrium_andersonii.AAC.1
MSAACNTAPPERTSREHSEPGPAPHCRPCINTSVEALNEMAALPLEPAVAGVLVGLGQGLRGSPRGLRVLAAVVVANAAGRD